MSLSLPLMSKNAPKTSFTKKVVYALGLGLGILALSWLIILALYHTPSPRVTLIAHKPGIGPETSLTFKVQGGKRGLGKLQLTLQQAAGAKEVNLVLLEKEFKPRSSWWGPLLAWVYRDAEVTYEETVEVGARKYPGLHPGEATLQATVEHPGNWLFKRPPVQETLILPVDLTPPSLAPLSGAVYVQQGGAELIVYEVGAKAVRHGVLAGGFFFPGYPVPGCAADPLKSPDKNEAGQQLATKRYFAFFAVPYTQTQAQDIELLAEDALGNTAKTSFIHKFFPKPLGRDVINLSESFMRKVEQEILGQKRAELLAVIPGLTAAEVPMWRPELGGEQLLTDFLFINRSLRKANSEVLLALAKESKPQFTWQEKFSAPSNAAVRGRFADHRLYMYQGKQVDEQDHLGFDLASIEHDQVLAANTGKVLLAKYLGIYGYTIVIDHGYGLASLYGHLSQILVKEGAEVKRGEKIGLTGATGMAGGDHLHFSMLLQGLPINPLEWWDAHWLQDRIWHKLDPKVACGG